MKKILFSAAIIICFAFGINVSAADLSIEVGARQQSGDYATGYTTNSLIGMQLGGVALFPLDGALSFRSGVMYTQRPLEIKRRSDNETAKLNLTYFDIPLGVFYKFEDYGGFFVGTGLSMLLEKSCSGITSCEVLGAKSPVLPFQLGASFKFMPQVGATFYYEMIGSDVADNQSNYRAIGMNLSFSFD